MFLISAHLNDCPEELLSNRLIHFDDIHVISAQNRIGIDEVKKSIRDTLDKYAEIKLNEEIELKKTAKLLKTQIE